MSENEYKKTVLVQRADTPWGGGDETVKMPDSSTSQMPQHPMPPPLAGSDSGKTVLVGFSGASGVTAAPESVVGWLVITKGPGKGASVQIGYGVNSLGRNPGNRLAISFGDSGISGKNHAEIRYDPVARRFRVAHRDGVNLTYVNGEEIDGLVTLKAGDVIKIAATELRFVPFCGEDFDWTAAETPGAPEPKA